MRLRYDDFTLTKIKELIEFGASNEEICSNFGVDKTYTSLTSRINKMRKELELSNTIDNSSEENDSSTVNFIRDDLSMCISSVNSLNNTVILKLSDGFRNVELEMLSNYSKQIKDIICKLENIQFLFDNIDSIRKEK